MDERLDQKLENLRAIINGDSNQTMVLQKLEAIENEIFDIQEKMSLILDYLQQDQTLKEMQQKPRQSKRKKQIIQTTLF